MSTPEGETAHGQIIGDELVNPTSSEIWNVNLELPGRGPLSIRAVDADIRTHPVASVMLPSCVPLIQGKGSYEAAILEVAGARPFVQADTFLSGQREGGRYRVSPGVAFAAGSGEMSKNGVNNILFSFVTFLNEDGQWGMQAGAIGDGVRLAMFKAEEIGATSLAVPLIGYGVAKKPLDTVLEGIEEGIGRYIGKPIPWRTTRLGRLDILAPNPTDEVRAGLANTFQNLQRLAA